MLKVKKCLIMCMIVLLILGGITVTFGANEVTATKTVLSNEGTVNFKLDNILVQSGVSYVWGISAVKNNTEVEKWFNLGEISVENKSAKITLSPVEKTILKVLRATDTVYLYIKDKTTDVFLVDGLKLDVTLPALQSFIVDKSEYYGGVATNPAYDIRKIEAYEHNYKYGTIYAIQSVSYQFVKITDKTLIADYLKAKANNKGLETLKLAPITQAPTNWKKCSGFSGANKIENQDLPTEDGLYYLWIKGQDADTKAVIGYTVVEKGTVVADNGNNNNNNNTVVNNTVGNTINNTVVNIVNNTVVAGNTTNTNKNTIKNDSTQATGKIPQTGENAIVLGLIVTIAVLGIVAYKKYHNYKDI